MIAELEKIKQLLWLEWDPIGVCSEDWPSDEYDSYAMQVFTMLKAGKGEVEIASYLVWAAAENMGLGGAGYDQTIADDALVIARKAVSIGIDSK